MDQEALEAVNGEDYLVCLSEDKVQSLACQLYCQVNWFEIGQCARLERTPVCQCSNSGPFFNFKTRLPWEYGALKHTLSSHNNSVLSLAVLPNGILASGSRDQTIKIWDSNTGALKLTILGHTDSVLQLSALPNGYLASLSGNKLIKIWDPTTGALKMELNGETTCDSLVVMPNGDLVSGSDNGTIKIWDLNTGLAKHTLNRHWANVKSASSFTKRRFS